MYFLLLRFCTDRELGQAYLSSVEHERKVHRKFSRDFWQKLKAFSSKNFSGCKDYKENTITAKDQIKNPPSFIK